MENANKSVYPSENLLDSGHPMLGAVKVKTSGITKREYFAGLAMNGILAKEAHGERIFNENEGNHSQRTIIAKASVRMADELLAELEKSKSE